MEYIYRDNPVFVDCRGEGPAVLLLHGWGCDHTVFESLREQLRAYHTVYSFDLPGFGRSAEPDSVWGVEEYTQLIEAFVRDREIGSPSLVGHSFGGRVALLYASRNRVERLMLVDAAGVKPVRTWRYYWRVYSYKFLRRCVQELLSRDRAERFIERWRRRRGSSDYGNASPRMRAVLSKVVNEDLRGVMPRIGAPALLFWGENDTATPLRDARIMEKLIPDAGLVAVPGAGHFSFLERPALFAAVVRSFFNLDRQ